MLEVLNGFEPTSLACKPSSCLFDDPEVLWLRGQLGSSKTDRRDRVLLG